MALNIRFYLLVSLPNRAVIAQQIFIIGGRIQRAGNIQKSPALLRPAQNNDAVLLQKFNRLKQAEYRGYAFNLFLIKAEPFFFPVILALIVCSIFLSSIKEACISAEPASCCMSLAASLLL